MKEMIIRARRAFADEVSKNDPAHQWGHFVGVFNTGMVLNQNLGKGYSKYAIFAVAFFHDLYAWSRKDHHELSCEWIRNTDHPIIKEVMELISTDTEATVRWSPEEARELVALACLEHRASYTGEFSSEFSELMNAADYEEPQGLAPIFRRAFQYARAKAPGSGIQDWIQTSMVHMDEKFSRDGYAKYPDMYMEVFGPQIEEIWDEIDDLSYEVALGFVSDLL